MAETTAGPFYILLMDGDCPSLLHVSASRAKLSFSPDSIHVRFLLTSTIPDAYQFRDRHDAEVLARFIGGKVVTEQEWEDVFTEWARARGNG